MGEEEEEDRGMIVEEEEEAAVVPMIGRCPPPEMTGSKMNFSAEVTGLRVLISTAMRTSPSKPREMRCPKALMM